MPPLPIVKIEGSPAGEMAKSDWKQVARAFAMAAAVGGLTWLQANWDTLNFGAYTQALAVVVPPSIVYLLTLCSNTQKKVVR